MKKRIRLKKQKQHNLQMLSNVLEELGKSLTIVNKRVGDGYYLFSFGASGVCHFTLKETPDWRYGIWLQGDKFEIFGEHMDLVDKFKPSRTYISHEDDIEGFVKDVKKVEQNPILYFVDSLTGIAFVDFEEEAHDDGTWYRGYQVKRIYNEETMLYEFSERDRSVTQESFVKDKYEQFQKEKMEQKENEAWDKKYAFEFFPTLLSCSEHIVEVCVSDQNKGGGYCSPRYRIDVIVNPSISQEEANELFLNLDKLIIEKNYSDERKTLEHDFQMYGLYDGIDALNRVDYTFKNNSQRV